LNQLAAAIIYSNAEIIRRIQCQLDFDLEERHFTENPIRIDEPDVKEILEEVATTWNAPILVRQIQVFPGNHTSLLR
jgi:hypothetical protein